MLIGAINKNLTTYTIHPDTKIIYDSAFYNCYYLEEIEIPYGVTQIGLYAFCNCNSLTTIIIPDSVTSIGHYAFALCDDLEYVVIGRGVTCIENGAFYGCESLSSVVFMNPEGWCDSYYNYISEFYLMDEENAAKLLSQTYVNETWYRE